MTQLLTPSVHRLAVAKETYLQGVSRSACNTSADFIAAIVSFDFSAETLIKTVLLDNKVDLRKVEGRAFSQIVQGLEPFYQNATLLAEIEAMHKLCDEIQHSAAVPSSDDIARYVHSMKLFFIDICKQVYSDTVTFDSISLALLLDSKIEKIITEQMEISYADRNFVDCDYYARRAVAYHIILLEKNLGIKDLTKRIVLHKSLLDQKISLELFDYLNDLEGAMRSTINQLLLREYAADAIRLLGDDYSSFSALSEQGADDKIRNVIGIKRKPSVMQSEAEEAKTLAYKILLGSQDLLAPYKDLDNPYVFDCLIMERSRTSFTVFAGYASTKPVEKAIIEVREPGNDIILRTEQLPKTNGVHFATINGLDKEKYSITITVENDSKSYTTLKSDVIELPQQ